MEEMRQREANLTALQAIGPRKKPKLDIQSGSQSTISQVLLIHYHLIAIFDLNVLDKIKCHLTTGFIVIGDLLNKASRFFLL